VISLSIQFRWGLNLLSLLNHKSRNRILLITILLWCQWANLILNHKCAMELLKVITLILILYPWDLKWFEVRINKVLFLNLCVQVLHFKNRIAHAIILNVAALQIEEQTRENNQDKIALRLNNKISYWALVKVKVKKFKQLLFQLDWKSNRDLHLRI